MADEENTAKSTAPEAAITPTKNKGRLAPPWPKGSSGNPKGRPKSLARQFEDMQVKFAPDIIKKYGRLLTVEELMFQAATGLNPVRREQLAALQWVNERKHGKTPDVQLNVEATSAVAEAFVELSKEELVALARQPIDAGALPAGQAVVDAVPEEVEDHKHLTTDTNPDD